MTNDIDKDTKNKEKMAKINAIHIDSDNGDSMHASIIGNYSLYSGDDFLSQMGVIDSSASFHVTSNIKWMHHVMWV